MAGISDALNEVVGSVRGVLGLSRQSRLREQIGETTDLFKKVKEHAELSTSAAAIAEVVGFQTARLLAAAQPPTSKRAWEWGPFGVGVALSTLLGFLAWFLYRQLHHTGWWLWLVIVPLALGTLVGLLASVQLLLARKPIDNSSPPT